MNHPLRPHQVGQNHRQQSRGKHQNDQNSDGPELKIAPGKFLNLLLISSARTSIEGWVVVVFGSDIPSPLPTRIS